MIIGRVKSHPTSTSKRMKEPHRLLFKDMGGNLYPFLLGNGVTGNTSDFDSDVTGSSPVSPAIKLVVFTSIKTLN